MLVNAINLVFEHMIATQYFAYLEFSINSLSEGQQPRLGVSKPSLNKDSGDTYYLEFLTQIWSQVSKRLLTPNLGCQSPDEG